MLCVYGTLSTRDTCFTSCYSVVSIWYCTRPHSALTELPGVTMVTGGTSTCRVQQYPVSFLKAGLANMRPSRKNISGPRSPE